MSYIQLDHIAYTYPSGLAPVFEDLTLHLDTDWKLGIIGRNGMGKSTFFKLLAGEIASEGRISAERSFLRFPLPDPDETLSGYDFSTKYLDESSQWKVLREAHLLGLSEELLFRPIGTLSGGERTKLPGPHARKRALWNYSKATKRSKRCACSPNPSFGRAFSAFPICPSAMGKNMLCGSLIFPWTAANALR